jgi:low affinity Fe/Cu permease
VRVLRRLAVRTPDIVGSPWAFLSAILLTVAWVALGFVSRWSTTWLLWPSAIASVVTFLIVFSLQYTQNRDTRAVQLKLDEILRSTEGARSELVKLERLSDEELTELEQDLLREQRRDDVPAADH